MNAYKAIGTKAPPRSAVPSPPEQRPALDTLELADWKSPVVPSVKRRSTRQKVKLQEFSEFTSQLSIMVKSGIDAATALGSLASQCQRPALASVLRAFIRRSCRAAPLSESLRRHGNVFDAAYRGHGRRGRSVGFIARGTQQIGINAAERIAKSPHDAHLDDLSDLAIGRVIVGGGRSWWCLFASICWHI